MIVTIGSSKWCKQWEDIYWRRAIKYAKLWEKHQDASMFAMFMSHMWRTTEPWAITERQAAKTSKKFCMDRKSNEL
jgi:hypothetical protein